MASHFLAELDYGPRGLVRVVKDADALAQAAAALFIEVTNAAVDDMDGAAICLSGGSTPKQMGRLLAADPYRARVPWESLAIFWGDERFVPLDSPESNAGEAKRAFLDHVGVPSNRVFPVMTTNVTPEVAADAYERTIRSVSSTWEGIPSFDLLLLGMGDDGHTASLFPHTLAIHETAKLVVANHVPKLDADRITLTPPILNHARTTAFLAGGAGKADVLRRVLEDPVNVDELPSQAVRPSNGRLFWLIDEPAAANLSLWIHR